MDIILKAAPGVALRGLRTARDFQVDGQTGTFPALAMGMNGVVTCLLISLPIPLFGETAS